MRYDHVFSRGLVMVAGFLMLVCYVAAARATDLTWNKGREDVNPVDGVDETGVWLWTDPANWDGGGVPVDGDKIIFKRIDWNRTIGIDINGAMFNLPNSTWQGKYNGSVIAFFDSAQMTPVYQDPPPDPNTQRRLKQPTP